MFLDIRMISEGSLKTGKSSFSITGMNYILKYIKIEKKKF